jgi:hypothetical protein
MEFIHRTAQGHHQRAQDKRGELSISPSIL